MAARDDYLIDTLVDMGVLVPADIEGARAEADSTGEGVLDTLVKSGVLASSQVAAAKAAQLGVEFIPLGEMQIADDLAHLHLVDPGQDILHRIFNRNNLSIRAVDIIETGVKRGRFARTGRAGHQQDAVRQPD